MAFIGILFANIILIILFCIAVGLILTFLTMLVLGIIFTVKKKKTLAIIFFSIDGAILVIVTALISAFYFGVIYMG